MKNQPTDLKDTILMMTSSDYEERFKAEYNQVLIRLEKLKTMLQKWDSGSLDFEPACPRSLYDLQLKSMQEYLTVLEARACIEKIEITPDSIPEHYYVRLLTEEKDSEQCKQLDEKYESDCMYALNYPEASGYGLFKRIENSALPDKMVGFCLVDTDIIHENFYDKIDEFQKQFPDYDFNQAALIDFQIKPSDKNVYLFFIKEVLKRCSHPVFLLAMHCLCQVNNITILSKEEVKDDLGFQYVENEWIYLPKEEI